MRSMTGFSKAEVEGQEGKLSGEARSVNSRYLELLIRLPKGAAAHEPRLRDLVKGRLRRGRVELSVKWEGADATFLPPRVNDEAIKWYLGVAGELHEKYGVEGGLTVQGLMELKDIFLYEEAAPTEALLLSLVDALVTGLNEDRDREGALIQADLRERVGRIRGYVAEIESLWPEMVKAHGESLREKISQFVGGTIDESRVLQEIAIYMERVDIAEEIVRLKGHVEHFGATIETADEMGRKLDFTIQEMVRETNTIGSKSNSLAINEKVIAIKVEIEKMREQVQNVE